MSYQDLYNHIIERAKHRERPNCYTERHHIIPKSIGGSDDETNIVTLTLKEHLVCHELLVKIHRKTHTNLIFAVFAFFQDANQERVVLRKRYGFVAGWLRRERTLVTARLIREMGHAKAARWNQMRLNEQRDYLNSLGSE